MKKELIEEIISELKSELKRGDQGQLEGFISYDTWGSPERSNKFDQLKLHIVDEDLNSIEHKGEIYLVKFRYSNSICSMGGTPDSIIIERLNTYSL